MNSNKDEKSVVMQCIDMGLLGSLSASDEDTKKEELRVSQELSRAFKDIGAAYIKNHGIPEELIEKTHTIAGNFFALPEEQKEKYSRIPADGKTVRTDGYTQMYRQRLVKDLDEMREGYDVDELRSHQFPSEVEGFKETSTELIGHTLTLCKKLLRCIELSLDIPEGSLLKKHTMNSIVLRMNNYPAIPLGVNKGVTRLGIHSDSTTFTLVFQDSVGGLEAKTNDGQWLSVTPIPGTIVINGGDFLEMWSSGRFTSPLHHVTISDEHRKLRCARSSIIFFVSPDAKTLVKPFDGSSTYPPVIIEEFISKKFGESFVY